MFQMSHKVLVCNIKSLVHRFSILKLVSDENLGPLSPLPLGSPITADAAAVQSSMDAGVGGSGFLQREYIFSAFFYNFLTIIITRQMTDIITSMTSKQNIIQTANARLKLMRSKSLVKPFPLQTRCTILAPGCRSTQRQNLNLRRSLCRLPCPTSNLMLSSMLCVH